MNHTLLTCTDRDREAGEKLGFRTLLIPDRELSPREYAEFIPNVANPLVLYGATDDQLNFAARMRRIFNAHYVSLGLPPGKTLSDWVEMGGTVADVQLLLDITRGDRLPTLGEFLDFSEDEKDVWVIPKIIPRGVISILGGPPKVGKTYLLVELIHSVASGTLFCAHWPTVQGKVMAFLEEDTRSQIKERFLGLAAGKGVDLAEVYDQVTLEAMRGLRLDDEQNLRWMREQVQAFKPDLIIFDALSSMHGRNENDRTEMEPVMRGLRDLCVEFGCAVVVVHHFKSVQLGMETRSPRDLLRGSTHLAAVARSIIGLKEIPGWEGFSIEVQGNQGKLNPCKIELHVETDENEKITSCSLRYEGEHMTEAEEETIRDRARMIYKLLQETPSGLTSEDIARTLQLRRQNVSKPLEYLNDRKIIFRLSRSHPWVLRTFPNLPDPSQP